MTTIRLGARLRAARKAAGFKTSKEFLDKYKIPASTYSQYESGKRMPDTQTLHFYSKVFEVNHDWLKTGKGNPFAQVSTDKKTIIKDELLSSQLIKNHAQNKPYEINEKYLSIILNKLIIHNEINTSKSIISKITKDATIIYANLMKIQINNKLSMKLITKIINKYIKT